MKILLLIFVAGCSFRPNNLHEPSSDMTVASSDMIMSPDLAQLNVRDLARPLDLTPARDMVPQLAFDPDVQQIFQVTGCITQTCHAAYQPLLTYYPTSQAQWKQNYDNTMKDVRQSCDMASVAECSAASLLLLKPLANSGVDHAGGVKPFSSTSDPNYVRLLEWIEEGAHE